MSSHLLGWMESNKEKAKERRGWKEGKEWRERNWQPSDKQTLLSPQILWNPLYSGVFTNVETLTFYFLFNILATLEIKFNFWI